MQSNGGQVQVEPAPAVLAPGNYDGVHRGHQALIRRARAYAEQHQLRTRVLTFDPHPLSVLAPDRTPAPLTTRDRKRALLRAHGVDEVLVQAFDRTYAAQTPEEFVERLLAADTRAFVVGHDFRFGKRAAGDVQLLAKLGQQRGFAVMVEEPVMFEGERVSSSAVRAALRAGDVERAARLQDRYHDVTGEVVRGDQRGRTLGFPTANLAPEPVLQPTDGVYAVVARDPAGQPGTYFDGVANLGMCPTFGAGRSLEVHLLGVNPQLYGRMLRVAFVARLRAERAFANVDELKQQLVQDCLAAERALAGVDRNKLAWI